MEYAFLLYTNDEDSMDYLAVPADKIETIKLSDTFDDEGKMAGSAYGGDYLKLISQEAISIANKLAENLKIPNRFNLQDEVWGETHPEIYDKLVEIIKLDTDEGEDYILHFRTIKGFHYFDGNQDRTVIVEYDDGEVGEYAVIDHEGFNQKLNEAIKTSTLEKEENGEKQYSHSEFNIRTNKMEYQWADYVVTPKMEDN